jgi:hypothetical protein
LFHPGTAKAWFGFEATIKHSHDSEGGIVTSVGFRLAGQGVPEYWWNGSAWVVNSANWNTEGEVSDNIGSFPVSDGIRIILGLSTTDGQYTPCVSEVKIGWRSTVEYLEEIILRTLIPAMRNTIKPIAEFALVLAEASDEIVIDGIQTPYNIDSIDSVFNETDDPMRLDDLYSAWNPTTHTVTLSEEVEASKQVRIRFVYVPEVAMTTSQDYAEVAKYPSLVVEEVSFSETYSTASGETITSRGNGNGVELNPPTQGNLDFRVVGITDKVVDHVRLADAIQGFFDGTRLLHSSGLDEEWNMTIQEKYSSQITATKEELYRSSARGRLHNISLCLSGDNDRHAIRKVNFTGMMNAVTDIEGD